MTDQLPLGTPTEIRASPTGQIALCLHPTTAPGQPQQPIWIVIGTQHADGGLVTVLPVDAAVVAAWPVAWTVVYSDADLGSVKPNPLSTIEDGLICDGPEECGHPDHG
jgi:hypothetical protein